MINQIKILTKLQLCNLFQLNVARYSKDKKKKNQLMGLAVVYAILVFILFFYVGAMSYGFVQIGLGSVLPSYLVAITSLIIFFFAMFKTGSVIFEKNSYDTLCSLPVTQSSIVISRFFRMYIGNLLLSIGVMLPGMGVYAYLLHPGVGFYLSAIIITAFIPMLPITVATLFGAIITAIASRMKHKSIVSAILSIIFVMGIMLGSSQIQDVDNQQLTDMIKSASQTITSLLSKIYRPAIWAGDAIVGNGILKMAIYIGVSLIFFCGIMFLVSVKFHSICRSLYSVYAKHNYKLGELKSSSLLFSLYKREFKRYMASSIYLSNTIVGPIMGLVFAIAILVMGREKIESMIPINLDIIGLVPIAFAGIFCIMTTTCTSISMEGKEWWITKSLPIKTKAVMDSKILLHLSVCAPFYFISEILMIIAMKPEFMDTLWLIILPALMILFAGVFGITVNTLLPSFDWENEVTVVKQSAASGLGGFGGFLIIIFCALPILLLPSNLVKLLVCLVIGTVTALLYKRDINIDLQKLG